MYGSDLLLDLRFVKLMTDVGAPRNALGDFTEDHHYAPQNILYHDGRSAVCLAGQGRTHQSCLLRGICGRDSALARQRRGNFCQAWIRGGSYHGAQRAFASFRSGLQRGAVRPWQRFEYAFRRGVGREAQNSLVAVRRKSILRFSGIVFDYRSP